MNINKIEAHNFLSYEKLIINFDDYKDKFVLIEGKMVDKQKSDSNGAGKSTIAESLIYGIFGKTIRNVKYLDDIVNTQIKKDCCVKIFFDDYVIERYRKHGKHKNNLYFIKDDNGSIIDLRGKSDTETQSKIEDAIGMDYNCFVGSHIFTGSNARFTSMSDSERKELLRKLSNAEWVDIALENVKTAQKENSGSKFNNEMKLSKLSGNLDIVEKNCVEAQKKIDDCNLQFDYFNKKYDEKKAQKVYSIKAIHDSILNIESDIEYYKKCVKEYTEKCLKNKAQIEKHYIIKKDIQDIDNEIKIIDDKIFSSNEKLLHISNKIDYEYNTIKDVDTQITQKKKELQGIGMPDIDFLTNIEKEKKVLADSMLNNKDLNSQIIDINTTIGICNENINRIGLDIKRLEKKDVGFCESCKQEISELHIDKMILQSKKDMSNKKRELKRLLGTKSNIENLIKKNNKIMSSIECLTDKINEFDKHSNEIKIKRIKAESELNILEQKIEMLNSKMDSYKSIIENLEIYICESERIKPRLELDLNIKIEEKNLIGVIDDVIVAYNKMIEEIDIINNKEIPGCQSEIKNLQAKLLEDKEYIMVLNKDKKVFVEKLKFLNDDLKGFVKEKVVVDEGIKKVKREKMDIETHGLKLQRVANVFGKNGIQNYIFNMLIPQFKNKVNYYVSQLSDDIAVDISTKLEQKSKTVNKINFNPYIVRGGGAGYNSISSGQKRRVDIATSMAIKSLYSIFGKGFGFSFYDEILDNLDPIGVNNVVEMLKRDSGTRFLITHNNDIKSEFDKTITINMRKNVSFLVA